MNFSKKMFWVLCLVMFCLGCTSGEPVYDKENEQPPTENPTEDPTEQTPVEEYVRLTLFSGCGYNAASDNAELTRAIWNDDNGNGALTLNWESVAIDSDKTSALSFILSDGTAPIYGRSSAETESSYVESAYSGVAVTPHEGDAYHADLQTVYYYNVEELKNATYCYAIAGDAIISEDDINGEHICNLEMPSTFTQTTSQDPSFLRDNMYMYATTTYKESITSFNFKHIPATFRFVITNSKEDAINLREVSIGLSEESAAEGAKVGSSSTDVTFDWADGSAACSFAEGGHDNISVATGNGTSLASGDVYTAYALALPMSDNNALKDKIVNFVVKFDTLERVAFELDGDDLAAINGSDIYNWVSGKSYTINILIQEDGIVSGDILEGNRIDVTSKVAGIYTLMYEGADGKPLENYAPICQLTVRQLTSYEDFIDVNVAPREAKLIGAYNSSGERQGSIKLSTLRPDYTENPLYSFGLLSDVHIGRSGINAEEDFIKALELFNNEDVELTCICGDITHDGTEAQLKSYRDVAATAKAPVYATTGNHDCTTGGINISRWTTYTGQPLVFEKSVERNGNVDHFLFFGMNVWNFGAAYRDVDIDWLEQKLEEYRNERCFIITHLFFPDRAGNLNNIYPSGNWLTGVQLVELRNMCDRYLNALWFSGHSHWEWKLQKYQDRANIYRGYEGLSPTSGWCVHVPSCGAPITSNGSSRVDNTAGAEGAIVHVYENHIDIVGVDLISGKYLPIATYRLDTTPQEVAEKTEDDDDDEPIQGEYIKASDFTYNTEKVAGATVTDTEGMENYVDVTFTAKGQGFYVSSSSLTSSSSGVNITVEDVQAFSNGVEVDIPAHVGFYGGSYYMTSTSAAEFFSGRGVQFQTSNSKYGDGPLPLTIRMKAKLAFY